MSGIKAVGLVSGGLDSMLATKVLMEQGIEVIPINFNTGFCVTSIRRKTKSGKIPEKKLQHAAIKMGAELDVPVQLIDISDEYMDVVLHPKHGYGAAFNPCIDCRIFMLKKAKNIMNKMGAHFIYTGEVLGQRPMTQYMRTLKMIEKESDLKRLLLRPLSAKLLPPTIPEEKGWVKREKLLAITGRSRKPQIELTKKYHIEEFAQPAGGCCFLVDHNFAKRIKDLLQNNDWSKPSKDEIATILVGRQFRVSPSLKVVVGRDEGENNFLMTFRKRFISLYVDKHNGPLTLLQGDPTPENIEIAARLTVTYSDAPRNSLVDVNMEVPGEEKRLIRAASLEREIAKQWIINPR